MTRPQAVAGLAVLSLLAAGGGRKYFQLKALAETPSPERGVELVRESRPVVSVDTVLHAYLTQSEGAPDADRLTYLGALLTALETPELSTQPVDGEVGETLAKAVIAALAASPDESPEGLDLRRRAVAVVVGRTTGPESKEFALKVLTEGPRTLRDEALRQLGRPGGVRGPELFAKVRELQAAGSVPEALLPGSLRRSGGVKAKEPILELLSSATSKKLVSACAVALQDYRDPQLLGPVFERLEQLGMLDSSVTMPWVSAPLLDAHLQAADGARLRRGMMALRARPTLSRVGVAGLEKGLSAPDAETRRVAAQAVRQAVASKIVDLAKGESLLAGRVESETEPVLKAELTGSLEHIRGLKTSETGTQ
ncbi:MAG: hypothetical protein SF051_09450 [Elusimicrobiota bacterium]|nr:hypothetical protein [Elusimicrobiota bacterium]